MNNILLGLITYNHYPFTYLALKSLEKYTPSLKTGNTRLIVIDNNSNDETKEKILIDFPWIEKLIIADKDCVSYQWNQFINLLRPNELLCIIPNDVVFGPNWLELLYEDTYRYDNVIFGSPYMNCDMQYDSKINSDWADNYSKIYEDIRKCNSKEELEFYLNNLYEGDYEKFCLDFQERNKNEPPIDCGITHIMLFKNELFTKHNFRFSEDYCPYFGGHEFDMKCHLNNLDLFSIGSSRSYVHHWVSIGNRDSDIPLNEKQKICYNNSLKVLQKWEWISDSITFLNGPKPSSIPNWRTPYHKFKLREKVLSLEEASKVPGIKWMCFDGIQPGRNYFDQIQQGSILRKDNVVMKVFRKDLGWLYLKDDRHSIVINEQNFLNEKWYIDYYWRKEEENYYGNGHMDFIL